MRAGACVVLLLVNVRASWPCTPAEQVLVCQTIPTAYSSGFTSLVMLVKDVGEINSTIFHSDSLASVTSLIMKSAGVSRIASGAFSSFQNLKSLSLSQNALTQVNPRWFGRPAALTELSLGENQIEVLDEFMFREFINLAKLNLTKNKIRTIKPNSFSFQTNLAELDLSGNRMTLVRPQVFRTLRSTEMSLEGNPWDCSCGVQDFVVFLKGLRNRSLLVRDTQVTCDRPLTLRGQPVWNVSACLTTAPSAEPTEDSFTNAALPPVDAVRCTHVGPQTHCYSEIFSQFLFGI